MYSSKFNSIIPNHIAIIMDGNGRWAKRKGLKRSEGHKAGLKNVENILKYCYRIGIKNLTLYAFSTENWKRPIVEINCIMSVVLNFLKRKKNFILRNRINLKIIGQMNLFPIKIVKYFNSIVDKSLHNKKMQLNIALSYGGKNEINTIASRVAFLTKFGNIKLSKICFKYIDCLSDFDNIPNPDILIRTGGELRISNFLLLEIAYTEFFFTKTLWPSFNEKEFIYIIRKYKKRNRKFGFLLK